MGQLSVLGLLGVSEAGWQFAGVVVVQLTVVFGIWYAAHNARRARKVIESTNEAVNHVPEGTPTLIQQVLHHGMVLRKIEAHQQWQAGVLLEVARQAGVVVPALPLTDEEDKS